VISVEGQHPAVDAALGDAGRPQRFDLRGEGEEFPRHVDVVERLFAEPVSCAEERSGGRVPDGKRPHPVETRQAVRAPLPVGGEDDLGVRPGAKLVAEGRRSST
jgi:hypothetical protein